jgi:CMP-N,N'-diacetyllegionaminic acid synthase
MKPLVVIPARGGSKGVPRKNIKLLGKKPLIQYTIEAAREVYPDSVICVSTDDLEIKQVVEYFGLNVPFLRPPELATDQAGTYEVIMHAIDFYEKSGYYPETLILLQVTSPFRTGKHIKEAVELFDDTCEIVVSVKETKANPYSVLREENSEGWLEKSKPGNFIRRQDVPKVWELNGAIYIMNVNALKETHLNKFTRIKKYVMDEIVSHDIDTFLDWIIAETIVKENLL